MLGLGTWSTQWRELRATFFEPIQAISASDSARNQNRNSSSASDETEGGDLGSGAFTAGAPSHYYEEFELQPTSEPSKKPILSSSKRQSTDLGVKNTGDKQKDNVIANSWSANKDFNTEEESDDDGDITAGSKLLQGDRRSNGY